MLNAKPVKEGVVHGRRMRYFRTGPLRIVQSVMVLQKSQRRYQSNGIEKMKNGPEKKMKG